MPQPFEIGNDIGLPLRGKVYSPESLERPAAVVVVCHGFKGFMDWGFFPHLGESLAAAGFHAVLFNFSGSGIGPDLENFTELDRFAQDTVSQQVADLKRICRAVRDGGLPIHKADVKRLGLVGHSRGGGICLITAAEEKVIGTVVTWSSVSSYLRWSEREIADWKKRGFMEFLNSRTQQLMRIDYGAVEDMLKNRQRLDPLRAIAEMSAPVLIVHGERDVTVSVEEAQRLAQAAGQRGNLEVVPQTGHTFGAVHPWAGTTAALERALDKTTHWLRKHLA